MKNAIFEPMSPALFRSRSSVPDLLRLGGALCFAVLSTTLFAALPATAQVPSAQAPTGATEHDTGPAADEFRNPPEKAERHPSGLISLELKKGEGETHPDDNDMVAIHFTAWDRDGKVFRTTRGGEGKPATMSLARVFPGWKEGLSLMVQGEKRRLWVPAHLGPRNTQAGPASAVFDVELLAVLPVPNPPKSLRQPAEQAERMKNGVHSLLLEEGKADLKPTPSGRVLVHYLAWNTKGEVVDSTYARGRPTAFLLDRMTPAISDVLQDMKIGERRNLWVPEFAHQGQWPGSPKGMLIFDIQLFHILPDEAIQPKPEGGS